MTKIHLIRHGKVAGEAALYGHCDVAVDKKINEELVHSISAQGIAPQQIISSPLLRCYGLADLLAAQFGSSVHRYAAFKEMNFGEFDGVPFEQIHLTPNRWQMLERFWQNPVQHPLPSAELLASFSYRVFHGWQNLLKQHKANNNDETVVVCHGGVIRMILAHVLNIDWRNAQWYSNLSIAYGSITTLEISDSNIRVAVIAKPTTIDVAKVA